MEEVHLKLNNTLVFIQLIAAITGVFYFNKIKDSHWKWFSIYLIIVFCQECFWKFNVTYSREGKFIYYTYVGVTIEYLFFYWLYANKSQKRKKLFILVTLIYIFTLSISTFFFSVYEIHSISINMGSIFLICLIILEFIKQIKSDDILKFKENKMFYINLGLILFYVGSYPFHVFGKELYENYRYIWNGYNTYFLATNCLMYMLFTTSFIWGKIH